MNIQLKRILSGIFIFAAISLNLACWGSDSTSNKNSTPTTTVKTPEIPRGCPSGTKACGDACIPKNQSCGGK